MTERPYESRFGGGRFTAAQFLAEGMVERQARRKGLHLPQKFWDDPRYMPDFVKQIVFANQLLKIYEIKSIFRALPVAERQTHVLSRVQIDTLHPLIQYEQRNLLQEQREAAERPNSPPTTPTVPEPPRPVLVSAGKHSIVSKLREFQGNIQAGA